MPNAIILPIDIKEISRIESGRQKAIILKSIPTRIPNPFKVYLLQTEGKKYTMPICDKDVKTGKVVGEIVCNQFQPISIGVVGGSAIALDCTSQTLIHQACYTEERLYASTYGTKVYGSQIESVKMYDTPKEINDFHQCHKCCLRCLRVKDCDLYRVKKAPKYWCYVGEL